MTKQELEQKEVLKRLARDIKFQSVMFSDEFGYSNREPLRYYLWLRELELWLYVNYKIKPFGKQFNSLNTELLQNDLKQVIEFHQTLGKLPKREKK